MKSRKRRGGETSCRFSSSSQCLLSSDDIEINPTDTEEEDGYTPLQLCINYRQRQWEACAALMRAHGAKERASFESDEDEDEDEEMEGASMSKTSINRGKTSGSSAPTTAFFSRVFNNRITSAVSKIVARPSTRCRPCPSSLPAPPSFTHTSLSPPWPPTEDGLAVHPRSGRVRSGREGVAR